MIVFENFQIFYSTFQRLGLQNTLFLTKEHFLLSEVFENYSNCIFIVYILMGWPRDFMRGEVWLARDKWQK